MQIITCTCVEIQGTGSLYINTYKYYPRMCMSLFMKLLTEQRNWWAQKCLVCLVAPQHKPARNTTPQDYDRIRLTLGSNIFNTHDMKLTTNLPGEVLINQPYSHIVPKCCQKDLFPVARYIYQYIYGYFNPCSLSACPHVITHLKVVSWP